MGYQNDKCFYIEQASFHRARFEAIGFEQYKRDLPKPFALWEMDSFNAMLGVTQKNWWENETGKLAGLDVLDVGCGCSYNVPYFALCENNVTGFDSSEYSLSLLNDILLDIGLRANLVNGFAEDRLFEESFDVVHIGNMLHHVKSVDRALDNAFVALQPGGTLLVVEPNYFFPFRWLVETNLFGRINLLRRYFVARGLTFEGEKALPYFDYVKAVKKAGFKIKRVWFEPAFFCYALTLLGVKNRGLKRVVFGFDCLLARVLPNLFKSFVYIVAEKEEIK